LPPHTAAAVALSLGLPNRHHHVEHELLVRRQLLGVEAAARPNQTRTGLVQATERDPPCDRVACESGLVADDDAGELAVLAPLDQPSQLPVVNVASG